ncbi:hypothetical protein GGR56DRAFT_680719 [Xylariaceae sp. FL0804]|nr:hypothetical protein GGR56DRAFT_680719 [Xylariaceae sp. FL0804]
MDFTREDDQYVDNATSNEGGGPGTSESAVGETHQSTSAVSNGGISDNEKDSSASSTTAELCIHDLVSLQASLQPGALAAVSAAAQLTYGELEAKSAALAQKLQTLGAGRGSIVPFCFEKSLVPLVAILATLKAGAAFAAIDPEWPKNRKQIILNDTKAQIVLTQPDLVHLFDDCSAKCVLLDWDEIHSLQAEPRNQRDGWDQAYPSDLAYVAFTSGTTGKPKGILIEHRAFCASASAHGPATLTARSSRVFQFASYTFDVSVQEILTTLIHGGCVCVPSESERHNDLEGVMNRLGVNWAKLTPTVVRLLDADKLPALKTLVVGGEVITKEIISSWAPRVNLIVSYGPAECSVISATSPPLSPDAPGCILGRPTGCCHFCIVDPEDHGTLVAPGQVGELLIEGDNLARGYLANDEKTLESFIFNTAWSSPRRRWYKTGDLVSMQADGTFHYKSRKDFQIKVNGQRVELGEVEHHLGSTGLVRHAVVSLPTVGPWTGMLTVTFSLAALLPPTDHSVSLNVLSGESERTCRSAVQKLEETLEFSLPNWMIPRKWVVVDQLPRLSSGKVDRRHIAAWLEGLSPASARRASVLSEGLHHNTSPSTEVEATLQEVWARVLNLETRSVSLTATFNSLGGDSITAMQAVSYARNKGLVVIFRDILQWKSINEIAKRVSSAPSAAQQRQLLEADVPGVQFDLTPIQLQHFISAPEGQNHYNQSFLVQLTERVSPTDVGRAVAEVVGRHETPEGAQHLFFTAHHLVMDIHSGRIVLQEMENILRRESLPAPTSLSFYRWTTLQSRYAQGLPADGLLPWPAPEYDFGRYWNINLASNNYSSLTSVSWSLSASDTSALLAPAHRAFSTETIELIVAAVVYSFSQTFSDRPIPPIHCEGHGREGCYDGIELSGTVGWFTSMFPVYNARLQHSDTATGFARGIKNTFRTIRNKGFDYFSARYLKEPRHRFREAQEILVNYFGAFQQLERTRSIFRQVPPGLVRTTDKAGVMHRPQLFEVSVQIVDGKFEFSLEFPESLGRGGAISTWSNECQRVLEYYARDYPLREPSFTISDFPLMHFDNDGSLDEFLRGIPIDASNVEDVYPCTPMQEAILISRAKDPELYLVQYTFELAPASDDAVAAFDKLKSAWSIVIQQNSILRTVFAESQTSHEAFAQVVLKRVDPLVCKSTASSREAFAHEPTKFGEGGKGAPPHSLSVYLNERDNTLIVKLSMSHAITDATSSSLILEEIVRHFENPALGARGPQFGQFIALLNTPEIDRLSYWKNLLAGVEPSLFPKLTINPDVDSGDQLQRERFVANEDIPSFCVDHEITIANLFQAAWGLALGIYLGRNDIVFGYISSGRDVPLAEVHLALGPYLSPMVARMQLDPSDTILEAVRGLQRTVSESLGYAHCSLALIQHELQVRETMFNTLVDVQRRDSSGLDSREVSCRILDVKDPTEYDVILNVEVQEKQVAGNIMFSKACLSPADARNLKSTLLHIVDVITKSPHELVRNLNPVGEEMEHQIMAWNQHLPQIHKSCAHELIQNEVDSYPDAMALRSLEMEMTYRQLSHASSILARQIMKLGVAPSDIVPFCMEKSPWAIVGMLAIMKAGAAFVPLDPSSPASHLQGVIATSNARLILVSESTRTLVEVFLPPTIAIHVADAGEEPANPDDDLLAGLPTVDPEDMAYVLFTSGSTGKPKGVVVSHRAMCSSMWAHGKGMGITREARSLQFASFTFDAMIAETFTVLIHGGCICIPSEQDRLNNAVSIINRLDVNWVVLTPTFLRLFGPSDVPHVRTVVMGGEAVGKDNIDRWCDKVRLINGYGPTETCVVCVTQEFSSDGCRTNDVLGAAIGCRAWIVDPRNHHKLVPLGAPGELVVEGPNIASGYLNDPERTTAAFIEPPRWAHTVGIHGHYGFYRTGDMVVQRSDGTLKFCGRVDAQVKVRGQRVELGGIEHHLLHREEATQAIVTMPKAGHLRDRLTAVLVLQDVHTPVQDDEQLRILPATFRTDAAKQIEAIRVALESAVMAYMVPATWIAVDKLPLLPSGKMDRRRVDRWLSSMSDDEFAEVAALQTAGHDENGLADLVDPMQQRLRSIWSEVLNIAPAKIGVNQPFINLGGDSITAMQVATRARIAGISLSVEDVLRYRTVAEVALRCRIIKSGDARATGTYIQDDLSAEPFPMSPIQAFFFSLMPDGENHYNQGILLRLKSARKASEIQAAAHDVLMRHPMLRSRFSQDALGRWTQMIPDDWSWRTAETNVESEAEMASLLAASQKSLDIRKGIVFSLDVVTTSNRTQYIYLLAHHLVVDLVSWRVVLDDLVQFLQGHTPPEVQMTSFPTWVRLQQEFAQTLDSAFQIAFKDRDVPEIFIESHGRQPWSEEVDVSQTVGWFTTIAPVTVQASTDLALEATLRRVKDARHALNDNGRDEFIYRQLSPERLRDPTAIEVLYNHQGAWQQLERLDSPFDHMQEGILISQAKQPELYEYRAVWKVIPNSGGSVSIQRTKDAILDVVARHQVLKTLFIETGVEGAAFVSAVLKRAPRDAVSCTHNGVYCMLDVNHALVDGGSIAILVSEIIQAYDKAPLPEAPLYSDFIRYLQKRPAGEDLAYWTAQLEDIAPSHFPSLDASAHPVFATLHFELGDEREKAMRAFCAQHGITLATLASAVWSAVLQVYIGGDADTVCFGFLASGRNVPVDGAESLVGPLITMLIRRARLGDGTIKLLDIARDMQNQFLQDLGHQHVSLAEVHRSLQLGEKRLFNTLVNLQRRENPDATSASILFEDRAGYDPNEAKNLRATVVQVLDCFVNQPEDRLRDVVVCPASHKDLLRKINHQAIKAPDVACVHDAIEAHMVRQPLAPAIASSEHDFTYGQLDRASILLASHLRALGVGPDVLVPYCMDKSAYAVVVMIAILRAGGACVALDPRQPIQRLETIIKSCRAQVVLSDPAHTPLFQHAGAKVLSVHPGVWDDLESVDTVTWANEATPHDVAFVNFTSGSTGTPKGIVLEHGSMSTSIQHHGPMLHIDGNTRALQFCLYSFDISVAEIVTVLSFGGCVCVPTEHERLNTLAYTASKLRVNWAYVTPTVAGLLEPGDIPSLQTLCLGGEPISRDLTQKWVDKVQLVATSGPAECSVTCAGEDILEPCAGAMGRPVGARIWIVDPRNHDRLAPLGAPGEMLIEGPVLARGYLNNEEQTAASFITDPAWSRSLHVDGLPRAGRRVYKTGDIARMNLDGTIRSEGRKGTMVKIHGQRVDIGEVEHHIASASVARHSIVMVPLGGCWKSQLVAVFTPVGSTNTLGNKSTAGELRLVEKREAQNSISKLREFMEERLPAYMVPRVWLCVEEVPFTPNGKLNRRNVSAWLDGADDALQSMVTSMAADAMEASQPTSALELKVQEAWSLVLNVDKKYIGTSQSFYSLGGDSISAMQVASRLRSAGVRVSVQAILQNRTIRNIAENCEADGAALPTTEQRGDDEKEHCRLPFQLSPVQTMHFDQMPHGENHFNQSFLLRFDNKSGVQTEMIRRGLELVVQAHPMLRARFENKQRGGWQQSISDPVGSSILFQSVSTTSLDKAEAAINSIQTGLDIQGGPVVGALVMHTADERLYLFLAIHHLVVDLVSWRIILQDLSDILRDGKPQNAPTVSFRTWTTAQAAYVAHPQNAPFFEAREALPDDIPSADLQYWGVSRIPEYGTSVRSSFAINAETTLALLTSANRALRTETVEIMMASVMYAFAQVFDDRELPAMFSEGHGREPWDEDIDVSRTVGWFTTIWPISITEDTQDMVRLLSKVKDARRRLPRKGWTYFTARYLTNARSSGGAFTNHDVMELLFNYLGQYQQLEGKDALFEQIPMPSGVQNVAPTCPRSALIEMNYVVEHGSLVCRFSYSSALKHQDKISQWIGTCRHVLETLTAKLTAQTQTTPTLSDYPLVPFNYGSLDQVLQTWAAQMKGDQGGVNDIEDIYPCSPMQVGILSTRARRSEVYSVRQIWEVRGHSPSQDVRIDLLKKACDRVIDRHQALRTTFVDSGLESQPYLQVVLRGLKTTPVTTLEADLDMLKTLNNSSLVEPRQGLPYRFIICRAPAEGRTYLRLDINHVISDGISNQILVRDIVRSYAGTLKQNSPKPPYREIISYMASRPRAACIQYWSTLLEGTAPCHFPHLAQIGPSDTPEFLSCDFALDGSAAARVRELCRDVQITVASFMRAVWAVVLRSHVGGGSDGLVCYGYLSSGRDIPIPGVDDVYGPLISMLVCAVDVGGRDTPVHELLQTVHEQSLQSLDQQHVSLADIQHAVCPGQGALFNTVVNVQRRVSSNDDAASVISMKNVSGYDPSEFDITLNVEVSDGKASEETSGIVFSLQYWTSCLSQAHASLLQATIIQVIESLVTHASGRLGSLELLAPAHREQLTKWNSEIPAACPGCVNELFEAQARLRPEAPAICTSNLQMSFQELDRYSTRLARFLSSVHVGPESMVCFCFDKSPWAIVTMLAILKAGGACVALSPEYPDIRVRSILASTGARHIVSESQYAARFDGLVDHLVVPGSDDFTAWLQGLCGAEPTRPSPQNPSFVTFTSGSTGEPKGIVLEHASMTTSIHYHGTFELMSSTCRSLQFGSYTFDVSVEEIFTTLSFGGCVCVPTSYERLNDLSGFMRRLAVNWAHLTPTVAGMLDPGDLDLRVLVLGGEAIPGNIAKKWASSKNTRLIASYGPAECSITCSGVQVPPDKAVGGLMGEPAGALLWIVDPADHDKLVPIGCAGEILIEGPLLARGYLDQAQTDAAFIYDPAWADLFPIPGLRRRRFYKSGDMARYNLDGSISSVGRKDNQVKLHGQRVDLREVEHHLATLQIRHSIALVPKSGYWQGKLVAFFSLGDLRAEDATVLQLLPTESARPWIKKLQGVLEDRVPRYMIPRVWVGVEALPATVNGKLDRKEVQRWIENMPSEACERIMMAGHSSQDERPANAVEHHIRQAWSAILNLPGDVIGLDQSFYGLGGDSISAMHVASRLRNIGIQLAVHDILRHKTISTMAPYAVSMSQDADSRRTVLCQEAVDTAFALTPIQQMFFHNNPSGENHYNQSTLLRLRTPVDSSSMRRALEKLTLRHSMLRARFSCNQGGQWTQKIAGTSTPDLIRFRHHQDGVSSIGDVDGVLEVSQKSLDIVHGPVISADLFSSEGGEEPTYLYLIVHHLVVDTVSWKTLLVSSSVDFSDWGVPPEENTYATAARRRFSLDEPTTAQLLRCEVAEPVDVIIAALLCSFEQVFLDRAVPSLFMEGHGRQTDMEDIDISSTVGWFTTISPIALNQEQKKNGVSWKKLPEEGILASQAREQGLYDCQVTWEVQSRTSLRVDLERLKTAFNRVVSFHQAFRTHFVEVNETEIAFAQVVMRRLDEPRILFARAGSIDEFRREALQRKATGLPYVFTICETTEDEKVYARLEVSHALIDGTSTKIFVRDLVRAYSQDLAAPPALYSDYISYLAKRDVDESTAFWTDFCRDLEPCLFPRLNETHVAAPSFYTQRIQLLRDGDTSGLRARCRQYNTTLANFLSVVWATVLRCYLGSENGPVCFGYLASGRDVPIKGAEDIIGPMITMLIRRIDVEEDMSVAEILGRAQDDFAKTIPHQHTSLARIHRALHLGGRSLFNTIVNQQKDERGGGEGEQGEIALVDHHAFDASEYDIAFNITDSDDGHISLSLSFWDRCISVANAKSLAHAVAAAVSSMLANPHQKIKDVKMLGEPELERMVDWNRGVPDRTDGCIHHSIERHMVETPQAQAVFSSDPSLSLTYEELGVLSSHLAQRLVAAGVVRDTLVPFCFPKSPLTVVAMVAIIRAGGACVGLDPSHPRERLAGIIEDTQARVALVMPQTKHVLEGLVSETIEVDHDSSGLVLRSSRSSARLSSIVYEKTREEADSETRAFVIFTSGSTGVPKGIEMSHGAFCTSASIHAPLLRLSASSRALQFAAHTYDISTAEVFTTLMAGGCVCVPSEHQRFNGLADFVRTAGVTWAFLTPTVAALLDPSQLASCALETLVLGGEHATPSNYATWAPRVCLINTYGPAECVILTNANVRVRVGSNPANIGRTIGPDLWVVHPRDHNMLQPVGAPGELVIGGPTLATGYLHDEAKTTAAFIHDPAWAAEAHLGGGRRFYKSGDLVRYNPDGTLSFIARKDTQVKIHGHRVELEDIEHHIGAMSHVRHAMVLVPTAGDLFAGQLIAVVSFKDAAAASSGGISLIGSEPGADQEQIRRVLYTMRDELEQRLPSHMIPSFWIPVGRLPYLSSGKLDRRSTRTWVASMGQEVRKKLVDLNSRDTGGAANGVEQLMSPWEEQVRAVWAEVLDHPADTISRSRNFFSLGGDSIAAMRVASRARALGLRITVQDLMRLKTIEGILIGQARSADLYRFWFDWKVIDLHQAFRCRFLEVSLPDTTFVQVVMKKVVAPLALYECATVQEFRDKTQHTRAYDDDDLPYRVSLCSTSDGHVYCRLSISHAIDDGFSSHVMLRDLSRAYAGLLPTTSPPPLYSDFIRYSRRAPKDRALEFWKRELQGLEPCLLPTMQRRSATHSGGSVTYLEHRITGYQAQALDRLCKQLEVTMADVFKVVWSLVLRCWVGTDRVCFGFLTSGRSAPIASVNDIVGPLINILVYRGLLDRSGCTLSQVVRETHETQLRSLPYQHVALKDTMHNVGSGSGSADDFFNTCLNVQKSNSTFWSASETASSGGLCFDNEAIQDPSEYDLDLSVMVGREGQVHLILNYWKQSVADSMAANILATALQAVDCLVRNPDAKVHGLDLFGGDQGRQMEQLRLWNDPAAMTPSSETIHRMIEMQAAKWPDSPAIHSRATAEDSSEEGDMTYRELNQMADNLAAHLVSIGVRPEVMVLFCMDKSRWAVVAVLGILKAGGAVVLADPSNPQERMRRIIADTDATIAVVSPSRRHQLETIIDTVVVVGQTAMHELPRTAAEKGGRVRAAGDAPRPDNAALVLFTSGSSGVPKGVVLEHRNLSAYCSLYPRAHRPGRGDRVAHYAAYAFDVSMQDLLLTLACGACVCVVAEEDRLGGEGLAAALDVMRVSWADLTPTVARTLQGPARVPSLRTLILGGEMVTPDIIEAWTTKTASSGGARLYNSYGPCECTITASFTAALASDDSGANIGRPSPATVFSIVDRDDASRLVPVGAVGELAIGGPLVARGYLKDQAKTDASFITDPPWSSSLLASPSRGGVAAEATRYYKTGDLASWNGDGTVTILGRKDDQVKLSGKRIELAEVEQCISQSLLVDTVIACVPRAGPARDRLIALVTLRDLPAAISSSAPHGLEVLGLSSGSKAEQDAVATASIEIQQVARQRLPSHMAPSLVIPVRRMPSTASGKTNRRAVVEWLVGLDDAMFRQVTVNLQHEALVAPTNEMEAVLRDIWSRALDIAPDHISIHHDFFRIGGDSVLAMRVMALARESGVVVTARNLFQQSTIARLAPRCHAIRDGAGGQLMVGGGGVGAPHAQLISRLGMAVSDFEDAYPVSPMQQSILEVQRHAPQAWCSVWIMRVRLSSSSELEQPLDGHSTLERLASAWKKVVDRHGILRTVFVHDNDEWHQLVRRDYAAPVSVLTNGSETVDEAQVGGALFGNWKYSEYENMPWQPPHRLALATTRSGRLYLRLELSHLLYDAVTMSIIWHDLQAAFDDMLPPPSSPAPRYRHFIDHLRPARQGHDDASALSYWSSYLEGSPAHLFPAQAEVGGEEAEGGSFESVAVPLDPSQAARLRAFCRETSATLANAFQLIWALVMRRFTQSSDVVFGFMVSGRDAAVPEAETTAGPFINVLPCRVRLGPVSPADELVSTSELEVETAGKPTYRAARSARTILRDIQADLGNMLTYQNCSRSRILEQVQLGVHCGVETQEKEAVLFNTVLNMQHVSKKAPLASASIQLDEVAGYMEDEVG